jgi:3-oxoacyl-[acyl-carrier protein] reductase
LDMGLKGKIAIVTGGSEGIGKAAATGMAREGASVVICARRPDVLEQAAAEVSRATGGQVTAIAADVRKPDDLKNLFDKTLSLHGRLDILVNNAGTAAGGSFSDATDKYWQNDLDIKLFGAIRCSRLALPHLRASGGGRIINITTVGGKAPEGGSVPTSVSRAAGIALTKAMSKEYAADNILVNTVCIGLIKSGQHDRLADETSSQDPEATREAFYADWGKSVPLGRIGETQEAGDLITFLASARAAYITGASVNLDGGMSSVV